MIRLGCGSLLSGQGNGGGNRALRGVFPLLESRLPIRTGDLESSHSNRPDAVSLYCQSLRSCDCGRLYVTAHVDGERERFFQLTHQVARPIRAPDFERHLPFWSGRPWRQHQIRHADDVVGMQVREEHLCHAEFVSVAPRAEQLADVVSPVAQLRCAASLLNSTCDW
jgi:hypothetical protein